MKYIEQTNVLLKENGMNVIFCPNYDFPYEPHFVLPIIINKKITQFFFNKKIKKSEIKTNEIGLWKGLHLTGKREIKKFLIKKKYNYVFDYSIKDRMIERILNDQELRRRQGVGGKIAIFAKYLYLDKLIFDLFKIPFPYMKLIINKKS
tara:strand:- start:180 stop:626 length:447 start_codon:yes stop_codon:yes gene_type:complete